MTQAKTIPVPARASWIAPQVRQLTPTDPLVLKAMVDRCFAAAARRAFTTSESEA